MALYGVRFVEVCLESSRRNLLEISRVLQRSTMVSFSKKFLMLVEHSGTV